MKLHIFTRGLPYLDILEMYIDELIYTYICTMDSLKIILLPMVKYIYIYIYTHIFLILNSFIVFMNYKRRKISLVSINFTILSIK